MMHVFIVRAVVAFFVWNNVSMMMSAHAFSFSSGIFPYTAKRDGAVHEVVHHFTLFAQTSESSGSSEEKEVNVNDTTNNLLERARKLRQEVSALESDKIQTQKQRTEELEVVETEKQMQLDDLRRRYTVIVPILKDMGDEVMERVSFSPIFRGEGKSRIIALQAPLPLGLILGEEASKPGVTCVDEADPNGNGANVGVMQGDIVRAITACQTTMETPTWQLIAGGIGQPKTKRYMYSVDGRPLEEVLMAVASNRMDPQGRDVWLVLERMT